MRKGALAWFLALVAVVGVACATQAATIKLTVATHINDSSLVDAQTKIMKEFEKTHPGVQIEVWHAPWDGYHDQLLAMFAGGVAPDVMSIGRYQFASFIEAGMVQPLDSFIAADKSLNVKRDIVGGLLASGMYKGKVYGFPIYNGPAVMFYNPDMFQKRGVTEPVQSIASKAWTREAFLSAAKKLTSDSNGDGIPDNVGFESFWWMEPQWIPFVRNSGGDVFGPDGSVTLDSQATVDAMQWMIDVGQAGVTQDPGQSKATWGSGSVGMSIRWQSTGMIERNQITAFTPEPALIPAGSAGYSHIAGGVPVAVSSTTKYPQLAYEFAKWLAMDADVWKVRGGVPLSWKSLRSNEYRAKLANFKNFEQFEMALSVGDMRPEPEFGVVKWVEMSDIMNELVRKITEDQTPVKSAVSEAARLLRQLVSK